jgi:hypothetical protein
MLPPVPKIEGGHDIGGPMNDQAKSVGDAIPTDGVRIEAYVAELKQLFNPIDPSPFRKRDLDPNAEEFIVGWAREAPRGAPLSMLVHLDRAPGFPDEAAVLRDAIHEFFANRASVVRRQLRELFHRGRVSLGIGLLTLAALLLVGDLLGDALAGSRFAEALRESLLIGGWVAMWRPLEIFLYDWWPIRAEARLYDRLGVMPVRVSYEAESKAEAWRTDWPAVSPAQNTGAQ